MRFSTPRAALAAALLGLPLAAAAQAPPPPPPGTPVGVVTVDGALTDTPYTLLGTNAGGPASGFGSQNILTALYAYVDPATSSLYLGVGGSLASGNRILVFVDSRAGGYPGGDFAGSEPLNGFPAGLDGFDAGTTFDAGFTADFVISIGSNGADYFVNVTELAGTRATEATTPSIDRYFGSAGGSDDVAAVVTTDPANRTSGFEMRIPFSATASAATPLAADRRSMQFFTVLSNDDSNDSFLSNQFITPAGAADDNYGKDAVTFEAAAPDPTSYVWQPIVGQKGWRQLAWPVSGGTVANYAAQNFVQGPGTAFPTGTSNVLTSYNSFGGTPDYARATGLTDPLTSGRGQFWYHYDVADFPGGVLPAGSNFQARPYTLVAGGVEPQGDVQTGISETFVGFTMTGNPFSLDLDTQGITVSNPGLLIGPLVYAWDPDKDGTGGYVTVNRNAMVVADRTVAPMQGFWTETVQAPVPARGASAPAERGGFSFTFAQASRVQGNETIVSRSVPERVLAFDLDRVTDAGLAPEWHSARLAFVEGATDARDAFDGGLPPAIGPAGARIGFAATADDGTAVYRGQESRAYDVAAPVEAHLALSAPEAGTYRLSWPTLADLPSEWALTLTDGDTGATLDLRTADHYDVTAAAGDWTSRFTVRVAPRATAGEAAPAVAALGAAFPNPATGEARLALTVDQPQRVRAELFDALGRRVALVLDATVDAPRDLLVNLQGVAPGVYVLRVSGDTFTASRRITVSR